MYIAVCDDQIEELEKLTALLQAWQSDRRSDVRFQTFRSGGQLLDAARAERFTLYLLDVLMPGMTGMDAAREIRSFDAAADIIFLTTSPGFALRKLRRPGGGVSAQAHQCQAALSGAGQAVSAGIRSRRTA